MKCCFWTNSRVSFKAATIKKERKKLPSYKKKNTTTNKQKNPQDKIVFWLKFSSHYFTEVHIKSFWK